MLPSRQTHEPSLNERTGAALVEFSVLLPVVMTALLMSIEAANGIFLRQAATSAAYEGARVVTSIGGTKAAAETRVAEVLNARGITNYTLTINPNVTSTTPRGTEVTVRVRITEAGNRLPINILFSGGNFESRIRMIRL